MEALTEPKTVEKVLVALAEQALPERMGTAYAEIGAACLICLGDGFGAVLNLMTSHALRFKHLVINPLAQIYW
jgi:hypothetical protein